MKDFNDCTKSEKVKRWEQAIRVLQGLTPHQRRKHWDMGDFLEKTGCGTIGCAAGFCSLDPWFRSRGYYSKWLPDVADFNYDHADYHGFFGQEGSDKIFDDRTKRPVGKVIREIKAHIKDLRSE